MITNEPYDPYRSNSKLVQRYLAHRVCVIEQIKPKIILVEVLEGIEHFADDNPASLVAEMRKAMLCVTEDGFAGGDPKAISRFSELYTEASDIVFPMTNAFLAACDVVNELSYSHSLAQIGSEALRVIDMEAHTNAALDSFRKELISKLRKRKGNVDIDVEAFNEAFNVYGEIIAYQYLSKWVTTVRLVPEGKKTPDFQCQLLDGKTFYVEVKSFDVVGGRLRNLQMMKDGRDAKAQLEEQVHAGKPIPSATTVITPYLKYEEADTCDRGETATYDPRSLIRVIDTLRDKSRQNFKPGQFEDGPTFALVVMDRLILPGGKFALEPYYYDDYVDGGLSSGVLWHMAYGCEGTPIFRLPEFAGKPSLEGHLRKPGLFVDETDRFPGPGLIVLYRKQSERVGLGLCNDVWPGVDDRKKIPGADNWEIDDTHDVLGGLCHFWNDRDNSRFFKFHQARSAGATSGG